MKNFILAFLLILATACNGGGGGGGGAAAPVPVLNPLLDGSWNTTFFVGPATYHDVITVTGASADWQRYVNGVLVTNTTYTLTAVTDASVRAEAPGDVIVWDYTVVAATQLILCDAGVCTTFIP